MKLEALYQLAESDLPAAIASPFWSVAQKRVPGFLAQSAPSFRLQLLRHHFRKHRENPWAKLQTDRHGEVRWPRWKAPVWTLRQNAAKHPGDDDIITSARIPLAGDLSFSFCATPACGTFSFEEPPSNERFSLNDVLVALFSKPQSNPREALWASEVAVDWTSPDPIAYAGVHLNGMAFADDLLLLADGDEPDTDAIATLSRARDGTFVRIASPTESPRPLFSSLPVINRNSSADGLLRFRWRTTFYLPLEQSADSGSWRYERGKLATSGFVKGASIHDLLEVSWKYQTMLDLEPLIARQIAAPSAHQLLLPIYESLLFKR